MKKLAFTVLCACLASLVAAPLSAGDCQKAIEYYNEGVKEENSTIKEAKYLLALHEECEDPEVLSKIFNNLADTYENRGEHTRAIGFYNKSIIAKGDYALPYFGIADVYRALGDYYSAYVMYAKGLKSDPDDEESQRNLKECEARFPGDMRVYFETGSSVVSDDYLFRLDVIADRMMKDPTTRWVITGFTDDVGTEEANLELSKRRAEWVIDYLSKKGVGADSLTVEHKGEADPVVSNDNKDGRTLNRRVDIRKQEDVK